MSWRNSIRFAYSTHVLLRSRSNHHVSQARVERFFYDIEIIKCYTTRIFLKLSLFNCDSCFNNFIIRLAWINWKARFTPCDDGTLSAYEHLSRCVYTRSDAARHIFAPLQYITALVPAVRGSRVYIVNIRCDPRRINNIRIAAWSRASFGPLLVVTLSRQSGL